MKGPFGITIIAILAIISGVVLIFGGLSSLVSGAYFASITVENVITELQLGQPQTPNVTEVHALIQLLGSISIAMGAIVMVIGIGYLVVSYGLLNRRGWAWTITVILTTASIIVQIVFVITTSVLNALMHHDTNTSLYHLIDQITGMAINGMILYYLYRPPVKRYFKKSQS
jgi:hypothetical protein